ncbi:MAG: FAD-dependent oxidoreductase [Methylococcales bacterium]|jgi:glycerol-3-phosphate dehydrogenase|nr:FAD-dependent oxidoreductase [Methylococcales bacterium]
MTRQQFDYDIIIIGGGIHGAGAAQAASAAGYRTLVLEKNSIGSGTSCKSSKLIHGGLRYLESAQFGVVKSCLNERRLLLKNAPDLVHLTPFYIPIYQQTKRRPWQISVGLALYQLLGRYQKDTTFSAIPKAQWPNHPIEQQGLQAVFQYWDAQTDDQLLTQAVMQSAERLGAVCHEHAEVVHGHLQQDHVSIQYTQNNQSHACTGNILINAGGPWVNQILKTIHPEPAPLPIDLVQGTHLIMDSPPPEGIYYVESPEDRRAIFIMPWKNKLMIGTTETVFTNSADQVVPLEQEIEYLKQTLKHYFPHLQPNQCDAFAGLRVLPQTSSNPFSRSRETILHPNQKQQPTVFSIYGGKLTEYRLVSEKLIQKIKTLLPPAIPIADTQHLPL